MPVFLLGLILGGLSGGGTYWLTTDGPLAVWAGAIAAVATWFGVALLLLLDD